MSWLLILSNISKEAMCNWDDRSLRRAFVHMQDAGQARAFFVKFTGEGVDDQGGPYRAVFETAVGEETTGKPFNSIFLAIKINNCNIMLL